MPVVLPHHFDALAAFTRPDSSKPTRRVQKVGQWVLTITSDPFTSSVACTLKARNMVFDHRAMVFQLPKGLNTFDAVYKIDQAPAVSWRVNAMELAAHGVAIQTEDLKNPSGGRVAIPGAAVAAATIVLIRPDSGSRTFGFVLKDLPAAMAKARDGGCGADFAVQTSG